MLFDNIKPGLVVRHAKNNNLYKILDLVKLKHPDNGEWYEGVYYKENKTNKTYCRTFYSFGVSFIEIKLIDDEELKDFTL